MDKELKVISSNLIEEAVYNLCKQANLGLPKDVYQALSRAYDYESSVACKRVLAQILLNAKIGKEKQRPLCQDTGVVVVFLEIGQNVNVSGDTIESAVNNGVSKAYENNYFRKSIVKSALSNRVNTKTNTPAIIHTEIVKGDKIKINLAVKGAGSENMSFVKMLPPSAGKEGIIDFVVNSVKEAGANPCPPIRLGIGIGGTIERAALLSKKALLEPIKENIGDDDLSKFEKEILDKVNSTGIGAAGLGGDITAYGVNVLEDSCHIASLPVAVNINCHSARHSNAVIAEDSIKYADMFDYKFKQIDEITNGLKSININNLNDIKSLKAGDEVLLTGNIFTARDAAHKKLIKKIENNEPLPFELEGKSIFYVGPCPAKNGEIIGPAGPTTSSRMDKYAPILYDKGVIATIGKGNRSQEVIDSIKKNKAVYFIANGGTAVLLAEKIRKSECIAFEELGAEAVYMLELVEFPVIVAVDSSGDSIY